jgi:hypothetical protein
LKFRIKIFCLTPEICALIQKVLNKYDYEYKCVNTINEFLKKSEDEIINECGNSADIVILDQELDKTFKLRLIKRFENIEFICLPSLDESDSITDKPANVNQISEPFKLSEFEEVLLKIIKNKSETDVKK